MFHLTEPKQTNSVIRQVDSLGGHIPTDKRLDATSSFRSSPFRHSDSAYCDNGELKCNLLLHRCHNGEISLGDGSHLGGRGASRRPPQSRVISGGLLKEKEALRGRANLNSRCQMNLLNNLA